MRRLNLAVILLLLGTSELTAQVRASERASVSQTIDGTVFTIDYARPRVRGRSPVFGRQVAWGEVWTPGANWATTLDVSRPVQLDGHAVPKGKYTVWFIVSQNQWTVVLDPHFPRYHTEHPDSAADQIRWNVTPTHVPTVEALTWTVPEVRGNGALLRMEWDRKRVDIAARVTPRHPLTIARAEAEPYVGKYTLRWEDDSTETWTIDLYYEGGSLKALYTPAPSFYPTMQRSIMTRINDAWFLPTIVRNGEPWEMDNDMIFEFDLTNGKATGFEMRSSKDDLLARGVRLPG